MVPMLELLRALLRGARDPDVSHPINTPWASGSHSFVARKSTSASLVDRSAGRRVKGGPVCSGAGGPGPRTSQPPTSINLRG